MKLNVRITEGDREVVRLEMPARVVEWIETLMPDPVLRKLAAAGVNLEDAKRRALASGLAPQTLFETASANRRYRVWIE